MTAKPTGHVRGNDLVITRTFRASIEDVWTSVTRSESTARWFGPWEGEPGAGNTIRFQMVQEEGKPWQSARIDACEAPRHLALTSVAEHGGFSLELTLTTQGDTTELVFVHHLTDKNLAGDYGPGWEYYLDMLVAAETGQPLPKFADYYPSQKAHYLGS